MKYLIDFDRTLFNVTAFREKVETDGREALLFTPDVWQYYNVTDFLYDDVLSWLQTKAKEDLYILTAITRSYGPGAEAYQKEKLQSSGFADLVQAVTFVFGEKGGVAAEIASRFPPDETVVFIDDRIEQCVSVKQRVSQAVCFLMVRDASVIGEVSETQGMPVVHSLAEVDAIIEMI